jgi:hypothetical protein
MAMSGIVVIGLVVCGGGILLLAVGVTAVYFIMQERDKG